MSKIIPTAEQIQKIADELEGSCGRLAEAACSVLGIEDHRDADMDAIDEALEDKVFECEECGWWYKLDEESDDEPGVCQDCTDDYYDGDEE